MTPMSCPRKRPAFTVAIFSASCAGTTTELRLTPLWMRVKSPISRNMLSVLLDAVPSVPRQRGTPASRNSPIGAKPFPSFAFEAGLVTTVAPDFRMSSISFPRICTQWARIVFSSRKPIS